MPISFGEQDTLPSLFREEIDTDNFEPNPDFLDRFGAAIQLESGIVNLPGAVEQAFTNPVIEPGYNPIDDPIAREAFRGDLDELTLIHSEVDRDRKIAKREKEIELLEVSAAGGAVESGVLKFTSSLIGFDFFLPGGAFVKAGKAVMGASKTGLKVGTLAATGATIDAATRAVNQEFLTSDEVLLEPVGAFVLGGAVGAAIGSYAARRANSAIGLKADEVLNQPGAEAPRDHVLSGGVGADVAAVQKAGDTELTGNVVFRTAANLLARFSPGLGAATSKNSTIRLLAQKLIGAEFVTKGNLQGIPSEVGIEAIIKTSRSEVGFAKIDHDQFYKQYRNDPNFKKSPMSKSQFNTEVTHAMRNLDTHEIPQIQNAARRWRQLFDKRLDQLQKAGVNVPNFNPVTAPSYMMRRWDRETILANRDELRRTFMDFLRKSNPELVEDDSLLDVADDMISDLLGTSNGVTLPSSVLKNVSGKAGAMKEKLILIPDKDVEKFLDNDIVRLADSYNDALTPEIAFRQAGIDTNLQNEILEIRAEMRTLQDKAKTPRAKAKIEKDTEFEIEQLQTIANRLTGRDLDNLAGVNTGVSRLSRNTRRIAQMAFLDNVVLASIPDVARITMTNGFRGFADAMSVMSQKTLRNANRDQIRQAGAAFEMVLDDARFRQLAILDKANGASNAERIIESGQKYWGRTVGITPWNTVLKQAQGAATTQRFSRIVSRLQKGQKVAKKDLELLTRSGIDETMAKKMAEQLDTHGAITKGSFSKMRVANVEDWDDLEAASLWRNLVVTDIDRAIVTPGVGDLPGIATKSEVGRWMFQFQSFGFAATNKMLLPALQRPDVETYASMLISIYVASQIVNFRRFLKDQDQLEGIELMEAGIDRSGILGWGTFAYDIANSVTGGGIRAPALGIPKAIGKGVVAAAEGEGEKALAQARRVVPLGDFFAWSLISKTVDAVNEAIEDNQK